MTDVISISTTIQQSVPIVWQAMNEPEHMVNWNFASPEWCCPSASNDLQVGGQLLTRMEAKDGSMGFDFRGVYTKVEQYQSIAYQLEDGRNVEIRFDGDNHTTKIQQIFEPEPTNSKDMQKAGWQAILDNFKKYVESLSKI